MTGETPRRIVVTGASGFVGRHLLPHLRRTYSEARLIAAVRRFEPTLHPIDGCDEMVEFDLTEAAPLEQTLRSVRPDAVIHLAAQTSVADSFHAPLAAWQANLLGTIRLAEAVLAACPDCRFILASSAEIYGLSFSAGLALDEGAELRPANPYAASKAACDLAIGEMGLRGLQAVRLRIFNHTGSGQSDRFVVASFAKQIAEIEQGMRPPVIDVGALDRARDFLDVQDVCAAYVAALETPAVGQIVNIASGRALLIGDILDDLIAASRSKPRIQQTDQRLRPTDVATVLGDAGKAHAMLGWHPVIPWHQTLATVLADWRQRVAAGSRA